MYAGWVTGTRAVWWMMLCCLAAIPATAEEKPAALSGPLQLSAVLSEAQAQNPDLKAARARWQAAGHRIKPAKSLDDPQFGYEGDNIQNNPLDVGSASQQRFGVFQKLPFPGKLRLRGEVAARAARVYEEAFQAKSREVIAAVKSAYYDLYLAVKSIEVNRSNYALLQEFRKAAEARYSTGQVSQADVLRAQVQISNLDNELITLEQQRGSAKARLNALLGRRQGTALGDAGEVQPETFGLSLDELYARAAENRPELKAAAEAVKRDQAAHDLAWREYFPDLTVGVQLRAAENGPDLWGLMMTVNVPIWFMWKQAELVRAAAMELAASQHLRLNMENQTLADVRDAFLKVKSAQDRARLFKISIIPQAEATVVSSQASYTTGKVDFLTLNQNQRELQDFQLEYYRALAEFEQRLADLERIVGVDLNVK